MGWRGRWPRGIERWGKGGATMGAPWSRYSMRMRGKSPRSSVFTALRGPWVTAAQLRDVPNGRLVHYCGIVTLRH
jgi:hypothetical protein